MRNWKIKVSLFLNYFVFAILLNSVGTVILQVQKNYGIRADDASVLEGFKDLSIAFTSLLLASYMVRIGYKRAMLIALALVCIACLAMPSMPGFAMTKLLFAATGVSFALIKVSVFATIGILTEDKKSHASFMNFIESFFMIGILTGSLIFSAFVDDANPTSTSWLRVYYLLAGLVAVAFVLLLTSPLDERKVALPQSSRMKDDLVEMLRLIIIPLVLVFICSAFLYVFLEQSIMSWLPTFNNSVLHIPTSLSVALGSILAGSTALGRFCAGFVLRRFHWLTVLIGCLVCAAALVLLAIPLAKSAPTQDITSLSTVPLGAYVFPMIGFFLAPIYPSINSAILSSLPAPKHAAMSGLIVVFSALGGTIGSRITGYIFDSYGGERAFYFSIVPMVLLSVCLVGFNVLQQSGRRGEQGPAQRA